MIKNKRDWIYIGIILLPFFIFYINIVGQFNQVPSPLYGGDYYYHFGIVQHIHNGNAPWMNPQIPGEYNHYGWLYHSLIAYTAKILGTDILATFLFFPIVALLLSSIIIYFVGKKLFKERHWAALMTFIWLGLMTSFTEIHGRPLAEKILFPLFFLIFLYMEEDPNTKNKIFLGLAIGALGLTHLMSLVVAVLFLAIYFAYKMLLDLKKRKKKESAWKKIYQQAKDIFSMYWPSAVIAIAVAMLYIGPLLFVYHFEAPNDVSEYSSPIPESSRIIGFFTNLFFNTSGIAAFVISLAALAGIITAFVKKERFSPIAALFITTLIGGYYYIITQPLGIDLMLYWQFVIYPTPLMKTLLITLGIVAIFNSLKKYKIQNISVKYIFLAIILIAIVMQAIPHKTNILNNQWVQAGMKEQPVLFQMGNWVKQNTEKNAVFLSTNELSGALNYVTGRKLVVNRVTHASQFVDFDERQTDVAIMLYGNSTEEIKRLLNKYNVDYVYYDQMWGNSLTWDPFLVEPENADRFDQFNVSYTPVHTKKDPGKTNVPTYDLLRVDSQIIWTDKFQSLIYPVNVWGNPQQPAYVIFAVNKSMI